MTRPLTLGHVVALLLLLGAIAIGILVVRHQVHQDHAADSYMRCVMQWRPDCKP